MRSNHRSTGAHLAVALLFFCTLMVGCEGECLRNSDCASGYTCQLGVCTMPTPEGGVDGGDAELDPDASDAELDPDASEAGTEDASSEDASSLDMDASNMDASNMDAGTSDAAAEDADLADASEPDASDGG